MTDDGNPSDDGASNEEGGLAEEGASKEEGRAYRLRSWALFATEAPRAVILRRGPRTHFHLIDWHWAEGTVTLGQWLKGQVTLCDLSPDGERLITFVRQYHRTWRERTFGTRQPVAPYPPSIAQTYDIRAARRGKSPKRRETSRRVPRYMRGPSDPLEQRPERVGETWTAVSRPPFFTALAIWPAFGTWTGGGAFAPDGTIVVGEPPERMVPIVNAPLPPRQRFASGAAPSYGVLKRRAADDPDYGADAPAALALRAAGARDVQWTHELPDGSLAACADGVVRRVPDWRANADPLGAGTRVVDLELLTFRRREPDARALQWFGRTVPREGGGEAAGERAT